MDPADALAFPRLHDQIAPQETHLEEGWDREIATELERLGHRVKWLPGAYFDFRPGLAGPAASLNVFVLSSGVRVLAGETGIAHALQLLQQPPAESHIIRTPMSGRQRASHGGRWLEERSFEDLWRQMYANFGTHTLLHLDENNH